MYLCAYQTIITYQEHKHKVITIQHFTCFCVLSGNIIDSSNDLFFLSRLPDFMSFDDERVMLCAFSGSFSATIDMLRDRRRPSLRVRSDMDPLSPRLLRASAVELGVVSSTPALSSLAPAICTYIITTLIH